MNVPGEGLDLRHRVADARRRPRRLEVDGEQRQALAHVVVELPRHPPPFLLLSRDETAAEHVQLPVGPAPTGTRSQEAHDRRTLSHEHAERQQQLAGVRFPQGLRLELDGAAGRQRIRWDAPASERPPVEGQDVDVPQNRLDGLRPLTVQDSRRQQAGVASGLRRVEEVPPDGSVAELRPEEAEEGGVRQRRELFDDLRVRVRTSIRVGEDAGENDRRVVGKLGHPAPELVHGQPAQIDDVEAILERRCELREQETGG